MQLPQRELPEMQPVSGKQDMDQPINGIFFRLIYPKITRRSNFATRVTDSDQGRRYVLNAAQKGGKLIYIFFFPIFSVTLHDSFFFASFGLFLPPLNPPPPNPR